MANWNVSQDLGLPKSDARRPAVGRIGKNQPMHVTAKADYAVRAVVELAGSSQKAPRKVDAVAQAQAIPVSFLENILTQRRWAGLGRTRRAPEGGWWLGRPPQELDLAT